MLHILLKRSFGELRGLSKHYKVLECRQDSTLTQISSRYIAIRDTFTTLPAHRRKIKEKNLRESFKEIVRAQLAEKVHQAELQEAVERFIKDRENRPELFKGVKEDEVMSSMGKEKEHKIYRIVLGVGFLLHGINSYFMEI